MPCPARCRRAHPLRLSSSHSRSCRWHRIVAVRWARTLARAAPTTTVRACHNARSHNHLHNLVRVERVVISERFSRDKSTTTANRVTTNHHYICHSYAYQVSSSFIYAVQNMRMMRCSVKSCEFYRHNCIFI